MKLLLCVAAAVAALCACPAAAESQRDKSVRAERKQRDHDMVRQAVLRREVLPLPRILALAGEYQAGEIIEVELKARSGRVFYDVHVLTAAGTVRELFIDARTGRLLVNQLKPD